MAKTESEIYEEFISYMNNPVWEFTESEHKMPMITSFITPAEAAFLTGFPLAEQPIEEIAASKEMSPEELLPKIKALCEKGLIYESIEEGSIRYRLNLAAEMFLRMPYWPGKDEEPLKSMAPHAK